MGTLTPGATYIYERVGGVVYARESGKLDRQIVGYNYDEETLRSLKKWKDTKLWDDIFTASMTNPTIEEALEKVKVLYYLSKESEQK